MPFPASQSTGSILGEQIHGDEVRQGSRVLREVLMSSCSCFVGKKEEIGVSNSTPHGRARAGVSMLKSKNSFRSPGVFPAFGSSLERAGSWERAVPGCLCPALMPIYAQNSLGSEQGAAKIWLQAAPSLGSHPGRGKQAPSSLPIPKFSLLDSDLLSLDYIKNSMENQFEFFQGELLH